MPISIRDHLHDRIDQREALAAEARAVAKRVVEEHLKQALDEHPKIEDALTLLAALCAKELDPLTTKAAKMGAAHATARSKRNAQHG